MERLQSRAEARRRAVLDPGQVAAVLSAQWPPRSRQELAALTRTLRRGQVTPDNTQAAYFISRVTRLVGWLKHRMARYSRTPTWTVTTAAGQNILFPINDPASTDFKTMVEGYPESYEKALIDFMMSRLQPGDVFVDVGANVGYISGFAATARAAVFALEIQRDLIPLIEQMATINGFDLVRALHVGASSRSGLSMMPRVDATPGTRLDGQSSLFTGNEPLSIVDDFVPMLALDDAFLDDALLPKLVKVDVEGHEVAVIQGARRIIEAARTTFVVEYHPHLIAHYDRTPDELIAPFDRRRWRLAQLTDEGLRPIVGIADVRPERHDPNPKLVFEPLPA